MSNNGKWQYQLTNSEIWGTSEDYDTKEDAIKYGREEAKDTEYETDYFDVGQIEKYVPCGIDVDDVLDRLVDDAYDEVGEVSDGYLSVITKEQENELEEKLNQVLNEWMEKHSLIPSFYKIVNVEKVEVHQD
jgi:uncharacterized protein YegP (UPF0339 family)